MSTLAGRVAVVAGTGPVAAAIGAALASEGASVGGGQPDVAVWAEVPPDALVPCPVVGLGEPDWARRCEEPLLAMLRFLQGVYPGMRGRDGRVVLVCPSVALEGAALLVPLATVA
ncbi:MAG TPA: hypothetical protein VEG62_01010, partial [Acidimicrobiales bacterium]|nr:hypothetical protein [Acidimicrobiales bacterium]